ncbi:protein FAM83A [Osmerus mordax]|uniref:protein FAM83A n=1 Tax=Osmerus mordax TaxID=8014 RepID=UPI00350F73FA
MVRVCVAAPLTGGETATLPLWIPQNNGLSMLSYRRSKPLGKVRRRLLDIRSPTSPVALLDLSHNENIRLATDALLDQGRQAYQEVLAREGEVDFLSSEEKRYILESAREQSCGVCEAEEGGDGVGSTPSEFLQSDDQSCCPLVSESNIPTLEDSCQARFGHHLQGTPSVEVCFQSDRATSMKDLVREFISKSTKEVAIVMDTFTDVEVFCDILEAMKRGASVHLLLDHLNVALFENMCGDLHISCTHLTNMSVRSVRGETYCSKSGRKVTGQIKEKFIILDSIEVLAGSYSFTWLSWQVHRNLAAIFKGSAVQPFHQEFTRLYACSQPIPGLYVTGQSKRPPSVLHLQEKQPMSTFIQTHLTQLEQAATPPQPSPHLPRPDVQPASLGLGNQRLYMAPQGLQWMPQRHTNINRPMAHQSFFSSDLSDGHLPWHFPNSNARPLGGTVGLIYRHHLLMTNLWFTHKSSE